jgi:ATP-dependent exoDNAse (exonuclease V) beta subunit
LNEGIAENIKSILSLAAQLTESPEWITLMSCEERHFELPVTQVSTESGTTAVIEGVIDAAGFDGKLWHVFDWKTDHCDDDEWATRLPVYQAQVDAYAKILAELYGHAANGSIVRITDRN